MRGVFAVPAELEPLQAWVFAGLERVIGRIDDALSSDVPAVSSLCRHVERFRGKMLRPTLTLLCGAAAGEAPAGQAPSEALVTVAAVVELVHMATLVHDDVLDEAETRRGGATINATAGNETAVILGDYLIAASYHLCSTLEDPEPARVIGRVSMELCAGELLQLSNRDNLSLDEATYLEILEGKTAALVGACGRLGARVVGADRARQEALERYGRRVGSAFQVQDDVLDLTGDQAVVGKTLGRDLKKGKLTLPVIHHLGACGPVQRGESLAALDAAAETGGDDETAGAEIVRRLRQTDSVAYAHARARGLVDEATSALGVLPASAARTTLGLLADAVLTRDR
jgi:octaprenyl-diphosphate synthase